TTVSLRLRSGHLTTGVRDTWEATALHARLAPFPAAQRSPLNVPGKPAGGEPERDNAPACLFPDQRDIAATRYGAACAPHTSGTRGWPPRANKEGRRRSRPNLPDTVSLKRPASDCLRP